MPAAQFNVTLLESLRPRWEARARPDSSMHVLLFTRFGATGYEYDERVEVSREADDRVRVVLRRMVENDKPIWPHVACLIWPHPAVG